jgi:hypothetical protein
VAYFIAAGLARRGLASRISAPSNRAGQARPGNCLKFIWPRRCAKAALKAARVYSKSSGFLLPTRFFHLNLSTKAQYLFTQCYDFTTKVHLWYQLFQWQQMHIRADGQVS